MRLMNPLRPFPVLVLCLLIQVGGLAAAEPSGPPAPRPVTTWRAGESAPDGVVAMIVVADQYRSDPAGWNLPHARNNAEAVRKMLTGGMGLPSTAICEISGVEVSGEAVRAGLGRLMRGNPGKQLTLLFYYVGHGGVSSRDRQLHLFTYNTVEADGGYESTIADGDLSTCFEEARRIAAAAGGGLQPVAVIDACRVAVMAPGPTRAENVQDATWRLFSAQQGQFAQAPAGNQPTPFTRTLVEVVGRLGQMNAEADLDKVFREVETRLADSAQKPELRRPQGDQAVPILVRPQRVRMTVRAVDALTGLGLDNAVVMVDGQIVPDRVWTGPIGKHLIVVRAVGFLTRTRDNEAVERSNHGGVLEISLEPVRFELRGRLDGVAEIRVQTADASVRPGYHLTSVLADSDGTFRLVLPSAAGVLQVVRGGQVVRKLPVPDPARWTQRDDGVRSFDLGEVAIGATGGSDALERLVRNSSLRNILPDIAKAVQAAPPEPKDAQDRSSLREALEKRAQGNFGPAKRQLATLDKTDPRLEPWTAECAVLEAEKAKFPDADVSAIAAKYPPGSLAARGLAWLVARRRLEAAEQALPTDPVPALEALGRVDLGNLDRPAFNTARAALAAKAVQRALEADDPARVAELCTRLAGPAWAQPDWTAVRRDSGASALAQVIERAVVAAVQQADWSAVDRWTRVVGDLAEVPAIRSAMKSSVDERIPPATRTAWTVARGHEQAARLTEAYAAYGQARTGATPYYLALIEARESALAREIGAGLYARGFAADGDGRMDEAVRLFVQARQYRVDAAQKLDPYRFEADRNPTVQKQFKDYDALWAALDAKVQAVRSGKATPEPLLELPPGPERRFAQGRANVARFEKDLAELARTMALVPLEAILARLPVELDDERLTDARTRVDTLRRQDQADTLARELTARIPARLPSTPVRLELRHDREAMATIGRVFRADGGTDDLTPEPWPRAGGKVLVSAAKATVERRYAELVAAYQRSVDQQRDLVRELQARAEDLQRLDLSGRHADLVTRLKSLGSDTP